MAMPRWWCEKHPDETILAPYGEKRELLFSECDVRTSLSDFINNCRPGADKSNSYYGDIWKGPKTVEGSVAAMRKSYAHQLTRGNSLWWFDMWGGWYAHPRYMLEARRCKKLYEKHNATQYDFKPEVAVFVDEDLYCYQGTGHPSSYAHNAIRKSLGSSGLSFELYLLEDFKSCYKDYKAIIFPSTVSSHRLDEAKQLCRETDIPYLCGNMEKWEFTPEELREFGAAAGTHIFCDSDDAVCVENSLLSIHSATAGEKTVKLPKTATIKNLCSNKSPFRAEKNSRENEKARDPYFQLEGFEIALNSNSH